MSASRFFLSCFVGAAACGVAQSAVAAWLSPESVTLRATNAFVIEHPVLAGAAHGVVCGAILALLLAAGIIAFARIGRWPALDLGALRWPVRGFLVLLFVMTIAGLLCGWVAGVSENFPPPLDVRDSVPLERWKHFTAARWSHAAYMFFGAVGVLALSLHTFLLRWRRAKLGSAARVALRGPRG